MQNRHGYIGLGHDDIPRESTDEALDGEEGGNGRAIAEDAEEEHVRPLDGVDYIDLHNDDCRNIMISARSLFIKSYTLSNSV
jgi:hypothetical protein